MGMQASRESLHRIVLTYEQTRKDMANLLHAQVQSRLLVLEYWLKNCQELVDVRPTGAREGLQNARNMLEEIISEDLRSITRQLYPAVIRLGLPAALSSLADRFRCVFDVEVDIDRKVVDADGPLGDAVGDGLRLTIYRVVEEALTNVTKHSNATRVRIYLGLSAPDELYLSVSDDGRGFDHLSQSLGNGVLAMEDYAEAQGGRLQVDSVPYRGTEVRGWLPLTKGVRLCLIFLIGQVRYSGAAHLR
jgi:signal transduction histidine kinase